MTKALHWLIFVMMSAQLVVGYLLTRSDDDYYESIPGLSAVSSACTCPWGLLSCFWPSSALPGGC